MSSAVTLSITPQRDSNNSYPPTVEVTLLDNTRLVQITLRDPERILVIKADDFERISRVSSAARDI